MNEGLRAALTATPVDKEEYGIGLEISRLFDSAKNNLELIQVIASKFSVVLLPEVGEEVKQNLSQKLGPAGDSKSMMENKLNELKYMIDSNNVYLQDLLERCRL
jgi:hypothetical protein